MVEMPIRRAPSRFTAVACKALPYRVRAKNCHSNTISASDTMKMMMAWPLMVSPARFTRMSQNEGLRKPSAPKNSRPRPVMAKCTPTETIKSTSALASASDW